MNSVFRFSPDSIQQYQNLMYHGKSYSDSTNSTENQILSNSAQNKSTNLYHCHNSEHIFNNSKQKK